MVNTMIRVRIAYTLYGTALRKKENSVIPKASKPSLPFTILMTVMTQDEIGTRIQTGAAVESRTQASFALETLFLSAMGLMTVPTARELK